MRTYKRGNIWYIDYTYKDKRYRKRVGKSQKLAELALNDLELKMLKKEHLGIQDDKTILFEDFSKKYLEHSKVNKAQKSYILNTGNIKAMMPYFKGKYLVEITPQEIERFKAERSAKVKPATVNRDIACLKNMLNKAIQWGYLQLNAMKGVSLLKEPPGRLRFLSEDEISVLLRELSPGARNIVLVAMYTGMRKSEILNLNWSNVDLNNKMIIIEKTKTNERRIIPINDKLFILFQELFVQKKNDKIFAENKTNLRRYFTGALKRANIKDFRFHDLRHTFASYLVMSGANLRVVQQLLGHKDLKMTMRYSHLSNEHLQEAVGKLNYTKRDKP